MRRRKFLIAGGAAVALGAAGYLGRGALFGSTTTTVPETPDVDEPEPSLTFFTNEAHARTARALFETLIPEDLPVGSPGASSARVIVYVDRAMGERSFRRFHRFIRDGLEDLERVTVRDHHIAFWSADPTVRRAVLEKFQMNRITGTRVPAGTFFNVMHGLALEGFWGAPSHGGNYRMIAWNWAGLPASCHS